MAEIKNKVRKIEIDGITIGGDNSISLSEENSSKPVFAIEIPVFQDKNTAPILQDFYKKNYNFEETVKNAENSNTDLICINFNLPEKNIPENIDLAKEITKKITATCKKPLILKGTENTNTDILLLPELCKIAQKPVIIAYCDDKSYEKIIPSIIKYGHYAILRSPIDINLAKEINILTTDIGLSADKILTDTDMGALGYGLDYGFSIIEKIRLAAFEGDSMLNMPIISFIGSETFKTKETKTDKFDKNYGKYEDRALMWEISAASAVISAGANVVVCNHPTSIDSLKEALWN